MKSLIEKATITNENKKLVYGNFLFEELSSKGYTLSKWLAKQIKDLNLEEGVGYIKLKQDRSRNELGELQQGSVLEIGFPLEVALTIMARHDKSISESIAKNREILDMVISLKKEVELHRSEIHKLKQGSEIKQLEARIKRLEKDSESENAWQQELVTLFSYTGKPLTQEVKIANPRGSFIRLDLCRPGNPTFAYELKRGIITRDMILHKVGQKDYFTVLKSKYKTPKLVFISPLGIEADALELIENVFNKDIQYQSLENLVKKAWKQIKDYHTFDKFIEEDVHPRFKLLSKWLTY